MSLYAMVNKRARDTRCVLGVELVEEVGGAIAGLVPVLLRVRSGTQCLGESAYRTTGTRSGRGVPLGRRERGVTGEREERLAECVAESAHVPNPQAGERRAAPAGREQARRERARRATAGAAAGNRGTAGAGNRRVRAVMRSAPAHDVRSG